MSLRIQASGVTSDSGAVRRGHARHLPRNSASKTATHALNYVGWTSGAPEHRIELPRRLFLHGRKDVAVRVQRKRDGRVSEAFAHDLRVLSREEQQGGASVAKVVQPEVAQPRIGQ